MSVPDQLALDLPGVAAPPPNVLDSAQRSRSGRRGLGVDPVDGQDDRAELPAASEEADGE